jgi:glycosyltransferase involved in cell wall biosynthesis
VRTNLQHREQDPNRKTPATTLAFPRRPGARAFRLPKRALIVSSHFPPERAAAVHRILRTLKQLRASNWPVAVLTVDPKSYKAGTSVDPALIGRLPDGVTVYRAHVLRGLTAAARWRRQVRQAVANIVGRLLGKDGKAGEARKAEPGVAGTGTATRPYIDTDIGWFLPAIRKGSQIIRRSRPDVLFSSAPPFTCHLVAGFLAWRHGITWVADFRDPWARSPWKRADLTDPWKVRLREWLEGLVVRRADAVILNTGALHDEFAEYYGPTLAKKFHTVTNGYDADHLTPFLRPVARRTSKLVLTHAGSLYRQRDPRPLVQAVASAIAKGRINPELIDVNFIGTVSPQFQLPQTIRQLKLESCVRLTPPVPHERCMQYLLESDVLIVIQPGTRLQVPVKLYEYLPFCKPILAMAPAGAVTAIADGSRLGVVVDPDDSRAIEEAICQLYDHRDELDEQYRADTAFIARFEGGAVSRQLQGILEDLP